MKVVANGLRLIYAEIESLSQLPPLGSGCTSRAQAPQEHPRNEVVHDQVPIPSSGTTTDIKQATWGGRWLELTEQSSRPSFGENDGLPAWISSMEGMTPIASSFMPTQKPSVVGGIVIPHSTGHDTDSED